MDEQYAIDVMSGRRRGMVAMGLRAACTVASWGYGAAATARNWAYARGWTKIVSVDGPVISLGNITAGGTGKTPIAAYLAQRLQSQGYRPGIVSRGYRQLNDQANDERLVLEQLLPGVPQVMNRNRVVGAQTALRDHGCDVVLLDDGFQHRRLRRDLDLVLIDATRPWGFRHLLPRGLLREPLSSLRRADLVLITRCDQASAAELAGIRRELHLHRGTEACVEIAFAPTRLRNAAGETRSPALLAGQRGFAFCGIGNPEGFRRTLHQMGLDLEPTIFPDHHHYDASDLQRLACRIEEQQAEIVLTTHKDLVKIPHRELADRPLWAVEIGVVVVSGTELLDRELVRVVPAVRSAA